MTIKLVSRFVAIAFLAAIVSSPASAKAPPVAKLVQVEGTVEYSRNGEKWSPITRTKYLFSGYQIRTGSDGHGKLVNQASGQSQQMNADTLIAIADGEISVLEGELSEPSSEDPSVFDSLLNKFAKAQRYTTVRRSVNTADEPLCDSKVRTIRDVTVSPNHADLVWRNACPEYSYRLVIDDMAPIDVPAQSTSEMIRYDVSGVSAGEHVYRVEVLDRDGTVYIPRRESKFTVLTKEQEKEILEDVQLASDDIFLVTDLFESHGLHVAAMDTYRAYFQENPEDNDMRPLLIQSYQTLKLSSLRESEARLYNAALEDDF